MTQPSIGASARALAGRLRGALELRRRHIRPAHGVVAVALAAALALAGAQLLDYRGVRIGAPSYADVESVAPPPEVARQRPSAAHGWAAYPVAIAAIAIILLAARGRWRLARLLVPLGLAVVVVSLVVDAPRGLDERDATLTYEGAEAILLEGFWTQLVAGATLACCGPLLATGLRPGRERARRPEGAEP